MLLASRPLMDFVNKHPTVVILCLGFLMMIGFSLVVEGFGFHIPKGYLYAAIGFSVLVEIVNQTMRRNQEKLVTTTDLRYRTASAVLRMLGSKGNGGEGQTEQQTAQRKAGCSGEQDRHQHPRRLHQVSPGQQQALVALH